MLHIQPQGLFYTVWPVEDHMYPKLRLKYRPNLISLAGGMQVTTRGPWGAAGWAGRRRGGGGRRQGARVLSSWLTWRPCSLPCVLCRACL